MIIIWFNIKNLLVINLKKDKIIYVLISVYLSIHMLDNICIIVLLVNSTKRAIKMINYYILTLIAWLWERKHGIN
jgi:hypothetical protein